MSVQTPASRQVALLIMITGLFAVVWSTDSGHRDEPTPSSPSAIAILMQTTAVESPDMDKIGMLREANPATRHVCARQVTVTWPVMTTCLLDPVRQNAVGGDVVVAPIPAVDVAPVTAPIPEAAPVLAPQPPQRSVPLVEWSRSVPAIEVATKRVTMDYRMTCHCCREYCGSSVRKVAVLKRQAFEMLRGLAESVARTANGVDWKSRLSAAPDEDDSPRRY